MKKVLTTYWLLAISGKRGGAEHRREEGQSEVEAKKEIPGRVLFAHDTSSAETHDDSSLLYCVDHRRPSSCTDRTMLAPPRPSAQCRTA